jgi:hypothetical protein
MLGVYVHTHWGYNHPYAARTWTRADWESYLGGLRGLGYDFLMIWPLLDSMPPIPNASDQAFLQHVGHAIEVAQRQFGMRVAVITCPNTIGNERAADYAYAERPYFACEKKVNPADKAAVEAFLEGRRHQLKPLAGADVLAVIDSDPGGYIGSTNDEFVALLKGQIEVFREFNPSAELMYWMLVGWENYNLFWANSQAWQPGDPPPRFEFHPHVFHDTLTMIQEQIAEPWWLTAGIQEHVDAIKALGLESKTLAFPYGLVEGEPTFPLTEWDPARLERGLSGPAAQVATRGAMANAQTHCLQLPHLYLFAHLAQGGTVESADLAGFARRLLPGLEGLIAEAWQGLTTAEPSAQRKLAQQVRAQAGGSHALGDLKGLMFDDPDRFLTDLAMNLEVRAALTEFAQASPVDAQAISKLLAALRPYQQRTGFVDAYGGVVYEKMNRPLEQVDDPAIQTALQHFVDWRDPSVRQGVTQRLLDAMEAFAKRG